MATCLTGSHNAGSSLLDAILILNRKHGFMGRWESPRGSVRISSMNWQMRSPPNPPDFRDCRPTFEFGSVAVFGSVAPNDDTEQEKVEHWATSALTMTEITRQEMARQVFAIENDQRQLKPCGGIERAQVRSGRRYGARRPRSVTSQKCHILLSLRAFRALRGASFADGHRLQTGFVCRRASAATPPKPMSLPASFMRRSACISGSQALYLMQRRKSYL